MEARSDSELMEQVRQGDVARLAILFERHHRSLFNYFLRVTNSREQAEDLVQDVFFRILKYRQSYKTGTAFPSWMYQIARNAWLDATNRRKLEVLEQAREPASDEPDPGEAFRKRQEIGILRRALASLPADKREILILSRFQDLNYEQIAEILEIKTGAVKVRVYRAMKALGESFSRLAGAKAS